MVGGACVHMTNEDLGTGDRGWSKIFGDCIEFL